MKVSLPLQRKWCLETVRKSSPRYPIGPPVCGTELFCGPSLARHILSYQLTFLPDIFYHVSWHSLQKWNSWISERIRSVTSSDTCDVTSRKVVVDSWSDSEPLGCLKMYQIFVSLNQLLAIIGWLSVAKPQLSVVKCQGQSNLADGHVITIFKSWFVRYKDCSAQLMFAIYFTFWLSCSKKHRSSNKGP